MTRKDLRKTMIEKIEKLTEEVKAMQTDPTLKNDYAIKIRMLMYWKRRLTQLGKK